MGSSGCVPGKFFQTTPFRTSENTPLVFSITIFEKGGGLCIPSNLDKYNIILYDISVGHLLDKHALQYKGT